MSDTRSTTDPRRRHRSHRRDPEREDSDPGSSSGASDSDTASRAIAARSSRSHRSKRRRPPGSAVVVREKYPVQQTPRGYQASEYSDDYEEYTVGGDPGRQRHRENNDNRDRDRERGILIVIAVFMVGLIFCLRASRRRER